MSELQREVSFKRPRPAGPIAKPLSIDLTQLADFTRLGQPPARVSHYIFMTDFCGSTLLANALGSLDRVFRYRERRPLVQLAMARHATPAMPRARWNRAQAIVLHYQAKTTHPDQVALFKEWGPANFIVRELLDADPRSRAVFLYSTLEEYLTAALKEPRRRRLARDRVAREFTGFGRLGALRRVARTNIPDHEACALHWLALMYQYTALQYDRLPTLRALRSRDFFELPAEALAAIAAFFGLDVSAEEVGRIVSGPTFGKHSKEQDRPYSLSDREAAIRESRRVYQQEIDAGLRFAERLLAANPVPDRLPVDVLC